MEETLRGMQSSNLGHIVDRKVNESLERAVIRVIETMKKDLSERITIDDMAGAAMFSKFHFTRLFRRVTGITPGRFLSAMRLQEAKRLLLSTSLSITEITYQVGYTSVGTFSTRFKESVGLPPTEYRRRGGYANVIPIDERRRGMGSLSATVKGNIYPPMSPVGHVFVGLFPDWIPQGSPIRCTVLRRPGAYQLDNVPSGTWHLLANAVSLDQRDDTDDALNDQNSVVGATGPITIRSQTGLKHADLQLRPRRILDPPLLLALVEVRMASLDEQVG